MFGSISGIFKKPKGATYQEDPYATGIKKGIGDWLTPQIGQRGAEYTGQLGYDYPDILQQSEDITRGQLATPWKSQYYKAEPLQAMKESAMQKARTGHETSTIKPMEEQMVKWGIKSSYGAKNPVVQAKKEMEESLGSLGKGYDIDIQNLLQQGEQQEQIAKQQAVANAMGLGAQRMPYQRETQYQIPYQDWLRREMFPYQTVAPLAMNYWGGMQQSDAARNQMNMANSQLSAMGSPFERMMQSAIGGAAGGMTSGFMSNRRT